jgi:hypothetical protein
MEQLPLVCLGRSGSGANQRVGGNRGQDVGRLPGFPPAHPFAKTAKGLGTPHSEVFYCRRKGAPPAAPNSSVIPSEASSSLREDEAQSRDLVFAFAEITSARAGTLESPRRASFVSGRGFSHAERKDEPAPSARAAPSTPRTTSTSWSPTSSPATSGTCFPSKPACPRPCCVSIPTAPAAPASSSTAKPGTCSANGLATSSPGEVLRAPAANKKGRLGRGCYETRCLLLHVE